MALNPGHDGAIALIQNASLLLSSEAEQDSRPRHLSNTAYFLLETFSRINQVPKVIATSGWSGFPFQSAATSYHGTRNEDTRLRNSTLLGHPIVHFESTHERSHIFCSYGLSPYRQGRPCYALVWEGEIGSFYEIDSSLHITRLGPVLSYPGYKYSFLFDLASGANLSETWNHDAAGKLMALAGYASGLTYGDVERDTVELILNHVTPFSANQLLFEKSPYFGCGVTTPEFHSLVATFSAALFGRFYEYAKKFLKKGFPLLISGGCGLNCEWNTQWSQSGLFADVFVPPICNDSGSAIGSAIEAQFILSGNAKLSWGAYSGVEFTIDSIPVNYSKSPMNYEEIAEALFAGKVVAWVQGRSEMGPRALGNRSLLASPLDLKLKDRLNAIKERETYRPIAPVCLEEDAPSLFSNGRLSPYMLYFFKVISPHLSAVTHVDGSARLQTVNEEQNIKLYKLLEAFKHVSGIGALCNTSLNRKGKGFINTSGDLFAFASERSIDVVVINEHSYVLKA